MRNEVYYVCDLQPSQKQRILPQDGQFSQQGNVKKSFFGKNEIDKSIEPLVQWLNQEGFITKYSCSGLKKDHPNKEIRQDGAYICFLYQENDRKKLNLIYKIAGQLRFSVHEKMLGRKRAMVIRIDVDKMGMTLEERMEQANRNSIVIESSFQKTNFGADTSVLNTVLVENGGLIYDTDGKIERAWRRFGILLSFALYEKRYA